MLWYRPCFTLLCVSHEIDCSSLVVVFLLILFACSTDQFLRTSQSGNVKLDEDEELPEKNDAVKNSSLAVVPWVPSQFQLLPTSGMDTPQTQATELMEADDMGEATMDIEENNNPSIGQGNAYEFGGMRENDGLNQWQQQHCMIPQLPQTTSTPITWFQ